MRKIKNFNGFNAKEFCISPRHWDLPYGLYVKALNEAQELSKSCNDICVAIVCDKNLGREYVLAETVPGTWEPKFILYNAVKVEKEEGGVRVVATSQITGGRIYEAWIKYQPGELA